MRFALPSSRQWFRGVLVSKSKSSIENRVQVVGLVAIVISLLLVFYELQQSQRIAGAELMAQQFDAIADRYLAVMGEDAAATIAKACHEPETLTVEEQIVLDAYLNAQFLTIRRIWGLANFGDILTTRDEASAWSSGVFGYIFAFPQSDAWWAKIRLVYEPVFPHVVEIGDQVSTARDDTLFCESYFEGWVPEPVAMD